MGAKYMILCFHYPYKGYWEKDYQTNNIFSFIWYLIKAMNEYDGVNVEVRK